MIVTKKALPRRTVLRGLAMAVALTVLDAMVPALTALRRGAGHGRPDWSTPQTGCSFPFHPAGAGGKDYALTILEPMRPHRAQMVVLSSRISPKTRVSSGSRSCIR